jgi:vesicular inhibitory amino acid transporter
MITTRQAFWHCMTLVLGLGTLAIPYTLKQLGWAGLVILGALAWLSAHTAKLLCICVDYIPPSSKTKPLLDSTYKRKQVLRTYPDIAEAAFGASGRTFVNWVLYIDLVASSALFLVFIATNMRELFPGYLSQELWVILLALSLLPTVFLQLQKLSFLSTLGSYIMLALVFTVLYTVWATAPESLEGNEYQLARFEMHALGNMVFAFACHGTLITIYREMQHPADAAKLFNQVYMTGYALKVLVGVSGYYLFAQHTRDQVTLNLPVVWIKVVITVSVSIKKWLTYALPLEPVAVAALEATKGRFGNKLSLSSLNLLLRAWLVALTAILALCLPHFGLFQALVGSLCAGFLVLIFPIAFYLKLYGKALSASVYNAHVCLLIASSVLVALATYYSLAEALEVFGGERNRRDADIHNQFGGAGGGFGDGGPGGQGLAEAVDTMDLKAAMAVLMPRLRSGGGMGYGGARVKAEQMAMDMAN